MTDRLYYLDSSVCQFDAHIVSCHEADGKAEVVLDRTAFYPTSGGQPFDLGLLGGHAVVDVIDREDGEIVHVLSAPLVVGETVEGTIDWARRRDHMQQHTGQHVLSAAFDRTCQVPTVSFHMGRESSTIDLAREVTPLEVSAAVALANEVVWEDRPVHVRFVSDEEARELPLRKPPARPGRLRIVDVEGFDLSACGGTHVSRTGMIGLVAVAGVERSKGASRVTFVCGARALSSHGRLWDVVDGAARALSATPATLRAAIERTLDESRQLARETRELREEVARFRALEMRGRSQTLGGRAVVLERVSGWDATSLKGLAQAVVAGGGLVAALIGDGAPSSVIVARSSDVVLDASGVLRAVTALLGGRGGGRPELAQGGIAAEPEQIEAALRSALS